MFSRFFLRLYSKPWDNISAAWASRSTITQYCIFSVDSTQEIQIVPQDEFSTSPQQSGHIGQIGISLLPCRNWRKQNTKGMFSEYSDWRFQIFLAADKSGITEPYVEVQKDKYVEVKVSNHPGTVAIGVVHSHVDFYDKPIENGNSNHRGKLRKRGLPPWYY